MKIAIISHTEHYKSEDGAIVGWGPTIKELNKLLEVTDTIIHLAPLHKTEVPKSALGYSSKSITFIPLKPSGGKGLKKLSILFIAPYNLYKIRKSLKNIDYIQFRAPTGMGLYILPFLKFFIRKNYWVKYAGNWVDVNMPLGNKLQKIWIQKIIPTTIKITVNGTWKNERNNIIPFENPCLDDKDRSIGKELITKKVLLDKITFCFVGALNNHKGVPQILEVLSKINLNKIKEFHFVGDSSQKNEFIEIAKKIKLKIIFHGFLPKDKIRTIYAKSHFILLPSKSEGFPKVIAEAMNYGCVPIVSDVSCISQYISNKNGFLLNKPNTINIEKAILKALELKSITYEQWVVYNYDIAKKFTYTFYNNRLRNEILIN